MDTPLIPPPLPLKILYCVSLVSLLPVSFFGATGWIGMMTGGGFLPGPVLMWLVLVLWRLIYVVRHSDALASTQSNKFIYLLRQFSFLLMVAGVLTTLSIFVRRPLAGLVFKNVGDGGIAYAIVGFWIYCISLASLSLGLVLFELSRKFSNKRSKLPPRTLSS